MKIEPHIWARAFLIKGAYNIALSTCLLVWGNALLPHFGAAVGNPAYAQLFLALCLAFGIGYVIVGLDIDRNHGIVAIGVLGQGLLFAIVTLQWFAGNVYPVALISGMIDLAFAVAFAWFLWHHDYVVARSR
jgi:hypothetical protein